MISKAPALLLFSFFFFLLSCGGDQAANNNHNNTSTTDPKVDAAYKSVMAVHDEVMPEMGTIHRLRKKLKAQVEAGIADENQKTSVAEMIKKLDAADEGMMSWMADFKMPKQAAVAEKLAYLQSEQKKIDKVSKDMFEAIEEAKKMLSNE